MTFHVPESKRSIAQNRFHAVTPDGAEFTLPKIKYLTIGQVEKMQGGTDQLGLSDILELFDDDPAAAAAVRTFDHEQLQALIEAWQADSEVTLGESKASE